MPTKIRPFRDLTENELTKMKLAAVNAMIDYSDRISMGGMSVIGSQNLYSAIDDANENEYEKSKRETSAKKTFTNFFFMSTRHTNKL